VAHVIIAGVKELEASLDTIVAKQVAATRTATATALHLIEREAKTQLTSSSHPRGTPTPSAPGDPPSLVSGNLRRSVRVDGPNRHGRTGWEGQVGPTADYGRIQELGGYTEYSYLPPRPYMQPAWDKVQPQIAGIYREAWRKALRVF
jgi:hypothetical protein